MKYFIQFLAVLLLSVANSISATSTNIIGSDLPEATFSHGTNKLFVITTPKTVGGTKQLSISNLVWSMNGGSSNGMPGFPWLNTRVLNAGGDLSNALATIPNNSTLYITPGDWTNPVISMFATRPIFTNSTWHIANKTNIQIIGIGRPTFWTTNYGDHFTMTNCQNVKMQGLTFRSPLSALTTNQVMQQFSACWMVRNRDVTWDDCQFLDLGAFGIFSAGRDGQNTNTTIRNCYFRRIGSIWAGFLIDGSAIVPDSYWRIENNYFDECYRGIEFYYSGTAPADPQITGTVVRNNYFNNTVYLSVFDGATGTNSTNMKIEGNTFFLDDASRKYSTNAVSGGAAIQLTAGSGMMVKNNNFLGSGVIDPATTTVIGIQVDNGTIAWAPTEFQIIGNTFTNWNIPIDIRGTIGGGSFPARNFVIKDNFIFNSRNSGIFLANGGDHVVEGNTLINCARTSGNSMYIGFGSVFKAGTNNLIRNNRIYNTVGVTTAGSGLYIGADQYTNRCYGNDVRSGSPFVTDLGIGTIYVPETGANSTAVYTAGCYTNLVTDRIVNMPANGATKTNRLRAAANMNGQKITIVDSAGDGAANNCWFFTSGSDTINRGPNKTNAITGNGGSCTVVSDGVSNWTIVSKFP
jgi:hypothetical protein